VLLLVFAVAVFLRSQVGNISGTEQPMDLMFVNAATTADHFPPEDPWLSGHTVAYYYGGYMIVAMTGKLAAVPTDIGYNVGLAMIAALAFVGAGGLVYNLVRLHADAGEASPPPTTVAATHGKPRQESRPPFYALLGVERDATDEQITAAYRRLARQYDPRLSRRVITGDRLNEVAAAYEVLSDPASRRQYDRELDGTARPAAIAPHQAVAHATAAPQPPGMLGRIGWKAPAFAVAGGLLLVVMGNLVWVLQFASAYGFGGAGFYDWVDVAGLESDEVRNGWYPSGFFNFFNASRIYRLDDPATAAGDPGRVITEFPMFSFVLGDLHPHVMALPFVLLTLGAALALYRSREPLDIAFWVQRPLAMVAAAIMVGGLAFINTWDIATLAFVVVAAATVSNFLRVRRITVDLVVQVVSFAVPLLLLARLLYVPFYANFTSQADGISAVVSNTAVDHPATRPFQAFLFWGPLFAVAMPFVFARLWALRERIRPAAGALAFAPLVLVVLGWALVFGYQQAGDSSRLAGAEGLGTQIGDRGSAWLTAAVLGALLAAALLALWLEVSARDAREEREGPTFVLLLITTALLLVLGTEFFYVNDVFNSRMNTVFKLYYQAWLLLAVAGAFSLYYLASRWRFTFRREAAFRAVWAGAAAVVLVGAALYPLGATFNRLSPTNEDGQEIKVNGNLEGLGFFSGDERAAIDWLQDRAEGQDLVIAEAVGNDYTLAGRISAATGLPAILGWAGHEDQWRGGTQRARAGRFEDVEALYRTTDMAQAQQILTKYGVTHVYVGQLERTTYGEAGLAKFSDFDIVFESPTVTIYRAEIQPAEVQTAR